MYTFFDEITTRLSKAAMKYDNMIIMGDFNIAGAQLGGREGWRPPMPFFENRKKCPDFGKKIP